MIKYPVLIWRMGHQEDLLLSAADDSGTHSVTAHVLQVSGNASRSLEAGASNKNLMCRFKRPRSPGHVTRSEFHLSKGQAAPASYSPCEMKGGGCGELRQLKCLCVIRSS